ncbi:MAG: hypothetical protein AAF492_12775 [Verrucomicrobiota bacterium]
MNSKRIEKIHALLKGIETGDEASVEVISPDRYIQHNPQTNTGRDGLAALFKRLSKSNPRVNLVRRFSDGDYVFAHTEYDFSRRRIGFEVFRFEGEFAVEHWDNIQSRMGPNPSGHTMVDGPVEVTDIDATESNRERARSFVGEVLINRELDALESYVDEESYVEHNPVFGDDLSSLRSALFSGRLRYDRNHRILANGNFTLSVSEGYKDDVHVSFYDLFRFAEGKMVEHWDTTEGIPPESEWKNENGKF